MIAILGNPTSDCYMYVLTYFSFFTGKPLNNSTILKLQEIDAQTLNMSPKTMLSSQQEEIGHIFAAHITKGAAFRPLLAAPHVKEQT